MRFSTVLFIGILTFLFIGCTAEDNPTPIPTQAESTAQTYHLDWKVDKPIAFRTAMNVIEADNASFANLISTIASAFDVESTSSTELDNVSSALDDLVFPEITSFVSVLEPVSNGKISVKMIVGDVNLPDTDSDNASANEFNNAVNSLFAEGTVQLRGIVTPEGDIASFYLESRQRNLLAMFFELPVGEVSVGDTWELDFNCISMGHGYIVQSADKTNMVRFTELSQTDDGRPLAVLDYMLFETVDGMMSNSLVTSDPIGTSMTCSYIGRSEFLIEDGRWHSMNGEFAISSTGVMNSTNVQQLALLPLDTVPAEYIGLE